MTVAFKIFGCRLNRAEMLHAEASLREAGCEIVPFGMPADVIVFHTCAVTQKAEHAAVRIIRVAREHFPNAVLVLSGCAAESLPAALPRELGINLVVPRHANDTLAEKICAFVAQPFSPSTNVCASMHSARAFLKVQDGCDCFCSYCIVPHTRGAPVSKPLQRCLEDAQAMIRAGFHEITVTGCNLALYADAGHTFADLLDALASLSTTCRIRIGSLEPGPGDRAIIDCIARHPMLCHFLHVPIQSGSDAVLARMKRRTTRAMICDTLDYAQEKLPHLALGADIICGFPGETDADFEATCALVEAYPFSNLHVFPYSERPGTPAATFPDTIPVAIRRMRAKQLMAIGDKKRATYIQSWNGKTVRVVAESIDSARGVAHGWTDEYLPCTFSGEAVQRRGIYIVPFNANET